MGLRWLHEVSIPQKLRITNSKSAYLVCLTKEEHDDILTGGDVPAAYLETPVSWKKNAIPPVPEPGVELAYGEQAGGEIPPVPVSPVP